MAPERTQNLQDTFLNHVRKTQDAAHHLSRERREAAGRRHLVRQFLRAAAPRWALAARLQARHLDDHAGSADPARRFPTRKAPAEELRPTEPKASRRTKSRRQGAAERRVRATARAVVLRPSSAARGQRRKPAARSQRRGRALADEAVGLAAAIDLDVRASGARAAAGRGRRRLFGAGKVEEIAGLSAPRTAELVIVDHPLTPVQQRNLETAWNAKVLDRTGLILEIFGERARTREGRLQVELAHLHLSEEPAGALLDASGAPARRLRLPRRPRRNADRGRPARCIGERIDAIERELEQVRRTRALHRDSAPARAVTRSWRWSATPMPASRRCSTR